MERRKLLLHINTEEDEEDPPSSSASKLLIECPRVVYTAFCFIIFLTTCLFLLILFVFLFLLNDINRHSATDRPSHVTTVKPVTTTIYRNKQSMFEYLRGLHRTKNKTKSKYWSKNLTETCLEMIQHDEFDFNNATRNNVFFTKAANEVIDEKFACCIESTLYLNPYKTVFLLNVAVEGNDNAEVTQPVNDTKATYRTHFNYLKSFYKNLELKDINPDIFFAKTPFERLDKVGNKKLLMTMVKLITLWKYSGLVNSKGNLLLSNLFYNQSTILLERSVLYSSYSQICSPVIEKLLLNFKTLSNEPHETVEQLMNTAIDNVTNECGQCDVKKLTQFEVCKILKPSCYFINIDSVWKSNVNMSTYCPKMYALMSKVSDTSGTEKKPPTLVSL